MANYYTNFCHVLRLSAGAGALSAATFLNDFVRKNCRKEDAEEEEEGDAEEILDCCRFINVPVTVERRVVGAQPALRIEDRAGTLSLAWAVKILQAVIDSERSESSTILEYAYTCDRDVAGAFGGGAVLIRRNQPAVWCEPGAVLRAVVAGKFANLICPHCQRVLCEGCELAAQQDLGARS